MLDAAAAFSALSDPTRLRILHLLLPDALCVGDLVELLGVPQPAASRHLAYLRKSGLVRDERRGQWMFYSLAQPKGRFHRSLLETLRAAANDDTRADALALRELRKAGGCCPKHR